MSVTPLTVQEVEHIAHTLVQELMSWDESIPDFETRFPHILEACLLVPFQTFKRNVFYKGLIEKSAILFYLMIKNHPFQNGNKRIAVTTLLYFLYKNNKWLRIDNHELYRFAKWVAESNPKLKEPTILAIRKILKMHIIDRTR